MKDQIAECFEEMSKAHEAIKKVYKSAAKLVLKLSSKGMDVFLQALALGTPDIPDTRVVNILQDTILSRKLCEEVKTTENVSLFDKRKENTEEQNVTRLGAPHLQAEGEVSASWENCCGCHGFPVIHNG